MKNDNLYNILNNFKSKTEVYKYFGLSDNSNSILKLKNIAESVGFDLNVYKERRKGPKKFCKFCGKELISNQHKFCSLSCSAKFSTPGRSVSNETKNKIRETLLNRHKLTKIPKIKKCKICGQEICVNNEICCHTIKWFFNLIRFLYKG